MARPRRRPRGTDHGADADRVFVERQGVSDNTVSRLHPEIEPTAEGVEVPTLGRQNGTFVQDVRGKPIRIKGAVVVSDGTELLVGNTKLTIRYGLESRATTLPARTNFRGMVGQSTAMRELYGLLAVVAATDSNVLITGETGTGKEMVAQAIHEQSGREGPFVVLDCGSLNAETFDSEVFGHTKGAYTGADRDYMGKFLSANGGTLLLDEIGEVPLEMQPRLLRMIETHSVCRMGETHPRTADVRFLAATHRDLPAMVCAGSFREDLYFRLAVLEARIPPLRARMDDLPLLLNHMLTPQGRARTLEPERLERLMKRGWPGNLRELRNFAERVGVLGYARAAEQIADAPPSQTGMPRPQVVTAGGEVPPPEEFLRGPLDAARKALERWWLLHLMRALGKRHGGNKKAAAAELGVDFRHVYKLYRQLGL